MSQSIKQTSSFPEDIFCPSSEEDSQQDELLLFDDHQNNNEQSTSFQDMIKKTFDLSSSSSASHNKQDHVRNDVLKWEQKLKADATKSKAIKLKQLKRAAASSSSSNKAKKSLPRDVLNALEEMENDAEEMVRLQQQRSITSTTPASRGEKRNEWVEESQTKYKDSLYRLGILERKITDHEAGIRKCTRKSFRTVGVTMEHKHRVKVELQHHKTELAKAEAEMIETRKVVDSQLRALFLIKLYKELEVQEEAVKVKEADVKKWEIILKKAEEGALEVVEQEDCECSSSSSSSSSSEDTRSLDSDEAVHEVDNTAGDHAMSSMKKALRRAVFLR
mmetsp:Transcript_2142/g.3100  ORF Transcript_2142/g.3100 Transcript_2142/m.3100 type:complete len:333 (-) Transcript_2142:141-1139(-)